MTIIEGQLVANEMKIGIVVLRFNKGSTDHYDYVCNEVTKGIGHLNSQSDIPHIFGVLTTDNIEQAIERAGTKAGNKGYDCALSAIEMVNLDKKLRER